MQGSGPVETTSAIYSELRMLSGIVPTWHLAFPPSDASTCYRTRPFATTSVGYSVPASTVAQPGVLGVEAVAVRIAPQVNDICDRSSFAMRVLAVKSGPTSGRLKDHRTLNSGGMLIRPWANDLMHRCTAVEP